MYSIRDLPGRRRKKRKKSRLLGNERSWEFTSSDEESFLPGTQGHMISCSQLLFDHRPFPNKPSPHQSPTFGPTLYKFIVTGPLGLVRKTVTVQLLIRRIRVQIPSYCCNYQFFFLINLIKRCIVCHTCIVLYEKV